MHFPLGTGPSFPGARFPSLSSFPCHFVSGARPLCGSHRACRPEGPCSPKKLFLQLSQGLCRVDCRGQALCRQSPLPIPPSVNKHGGLRQQKYHLPPPRPTLAFVQTSDFTRAFESPTNPHIPTESSNCYDLSITPTHSFTSDCIVIVHCQNPTDWDSPFAPLPPSTSCCAAPLSRALSPSFLRCRSANFSRKFKPRFSIHILFSRNRSLGVHSLGPVISRHPVLHTPDSPPDDPFHYRHHPFA